MVFDMVNWKGKTYIATKNGLFVFSGGTISEHYKKEQGLPSNIILDMDTYDGVWANFSLLHASKSDFPHHIEAIYRALKPEGLFFIALKTGDGEKRDTLGRFYAYYQQEELTSILNGAGFKTDHIISGASRGMEGTVEPWIGIYAHKT